MNKIFFIAIVASIGLTMFFSCKQSMPEDAFPSPQRNEKTGKWGFVYEKRKIITDRYDSADEFSSGLARVELDKKWGYIDKTGTEIISLKYQVANNFKGDLAKVGLNGKYGLIDKTGKAIIPLIYESIDDFNEDLVKVGLNGKYGFIDKTGKEIIQIKYDRIGHFNNGLVSVKLNEKYGFVNRKGKTVIPLIYDEANDFVNGYAHVSLPDSAGKIDTCGIFTIQSMKIPLQEAVEKQYVRFSAHGNSIESSNITIENVTDLKLQLTIPAGTFLSANSSSFQNMVLTSPKDIVIDAGKRYSGTVSTACMNIHRDIPDGNNAFGLAKRPENHLLSKVIRLLNEGNYKYSVIQAAVWIVTDSANYYDMGILQDQFYQRIIDSEDYQKAVSIVNEARKME